MAFQKIDSFQLPLARRTNGLTMGISSITLTHYLDYSSKFGKIGFTGKAYSTSLDSKIQLPFAL